jgi:hypothetical protein
LLTDGEEISNLYRGPSIDASYQVSIHLAKWFQRRTFLEIGTKLAIFIQDLTMMLPTKFQFIWERSFRGEDFLEINQSETRMACGGHVC